MLKVSMQCSELILYNTWHFFRKIMIIYQIVNYPLLSFEVKSQQGILIESEKLNLYGKPQKSSFLVGRTLIGGGGQGPGH